MCNVSQPSSPAGAALAPDLSFIIPALNEARNISRTLESIRQQAAAYSHQVIVVDNGSIDATAQLAREAGATVLLQPASTIATARNVGADHAQGRILIFLDADVSLTDAWRQNLPACLSTLDGAAPVVTGSHCSPPDHCGWIERHWFGETAVEQNVSHLGTGHMLLRRDFFLRLGGFNGGMETGEDYEFCQRARAAGARIFNDSQLRVIHHDFPRSLRQFIRREAWHGRGDLRSPASFLQSKVALGATVFLVAHALLFVGMLAYPIAALAGLLLLLLLLAASTWKKYRHASWRSRLINGGLFYAYYLGRSASFLYAVEKRAEGVAASEA